MMKSIFSTVIIAAILFGISTNAFGQKKSKEDQMKRGNWQTTAGSILVLGGLTASTAGLFMSFDQEGGETGHQLFIWGLVSAIVGTPVLTVGLINRHRANRMSLKYEPIHIPKYAGNLPRSVPSITYSIPLN